MNQDWSSSFEEVVTRHFKPVANQVGAVLEKLRTGIFQIKAGAFVLRIRDGIGHQHDFLVTLASSFDRPADLDELSGEIGLGRIAEFQGYSYTRARVITRKTLDQAMMDAASAAEKLCVPYLLGQRADFHQVHQYVEELFKATGIQNKTFKSPPYVREEWGSPQTEEHR